MAAFANIAKVVRKEVVAPLAVFAFGLAENTFGRWAAAFAASDRMHSSISVLTRICQK